MLDTFIGMIDFNLNITEEQFKTAKIQIKKRISQANGNRLILMDNQIHRVSGAPTASQSCNDKIQNVELLSLPFKKHSTCSNLNDDSEIGHRRKGSNATATSTVSSNPETQESEKGFKSDLETSSQGSI